MKKSKDRDTVHKTKRHGTEKRQTLSNLTKRTLGSGNLRAAVRVPQGEERNEWLAANTVDFFNELTLLYGICAEDAKRFNKVGDGFPPGFEYRWADASTKKAMRVSAPEYVDYVMTWVEAQIDNQEIFPVTEDNEFPAEFETYIKDIFKRMFRVFAIIYHRHFETMEKLEAAAHLNTCFKHFMFFSFEFDLLDDKEKAALKGPCERLHNQYVEQGEEEKAAAAA